MDNETRKLIYSATSALKFVYSHRFEKYANLEDKIYLRDKAIGLSLILNDYSIDTEEQQEVRGEILNKLIVEFWEEVNKRLPFIKIGIDEYEKAKR